MILLLSIFKKNKQYYIHTFDTSVGVADTRLVNSYNLRECSNINVQKSITSKQNPKEYLRGEYDVAKLIVDEEHLQERANDFQIVTVYYKDDKPCLYLSVDRLGNLSLHDISELTYARNSIFGNKIKSFPSFVEHKPVLCAYEYLKMLNEEKIKDMPVGLFKQYLLYVKGFEEGYHTVIEINNGVPLFVHEHMLFKGSATIKLIEYIPKKKKTYLTKQDFISNPYPMERTVGFLTNFINLVVSTNLPSKKFSYENISLCFYDMKSLFLSVPASSYGLKRMENFDNSKKMYEGWHLDHNSNLPKEVYANILPNEIFKLPNRFYSDIKNKPFCYDFSSNLKEENEFVDMWIYTVAFYCFWGYYSHLFKKKLRFIIKDYKRMYEIALTNLISALGPRDTLYVMKWTKEDLNKTLKNVIGIAPSGDVITYDGDEEPDIFTLKQNPYNLPEALRVYSAETIDQYGLEKLMSEFANLAPDRQKVVINQLEEIEKTIQKRKEQDSQEQQRLLNTM